MARRPCNCGGRRSGKSGKETKSSERQRFTLETQDGRTMSFGSQLEAEAARVREGGGNIRRAR